MASMSTSTSCKVSFAEEEKEILQKASEICKNVGNEIWHDRNGSDEEDTVSFFFSDLGKNIERALKGIIIDERRWKIIISTSHKLAKELLDKPNGFITATIGGEEYIIDNTRRVTNNANLDDSDTHWTLNLRDGGNGNIKRWNACFIGWGSRWNMTGKEIENIIYAIGLIGWIPILAIFSGIAKVISALKEIILAGTVWILI